MANATIDANSKHRVEYKTHTANKQPNDFARGSRARCEHYADA